MTVETLGPARARLTATVPWATLDPVLREACATGVLAGFRTGRLPFHPIDQRCGAAVLPRAVEAALLDLVVTSARRHGLEPLGRADVDVVGCGEGAPLRFAAVLDVRPDFAIPDPAALRIRVDPVSVPEDEVREGLDALRERFRTLVDVDRPAADGDVVDLRVRVDQTVLDGTGYEIGSGRPPVGVDPAVLAVERLPSILDTALVGLPPGGSVTLTPRLSGRELAITVTAVREKRLPPLDDQLAVRAGRGSTVDELRAAVTEQLRQAKDAARLRAARDEALSQLTTAAAVPAPEGLVRDEVEHRRQWMVDELHRLGTSLADHLAATGTTVAELDAALVAATTQRVRSQLLLDAIADAERLTVPTSQAQAADVRRGKALTLLMQRVTFVDPAGNHLTIPAGTF